MQCDENNILDNRLTELHWFYSPFYFMDSKVDSQKICKMRSIGREPVLVLDRNIFSRLINVVSKGKTDEGSTKDIAFLIVWSVLNDVKILPYYALNEVAEGKNSEMAAQREYSIFKKIFTDITLLEWLTLASGLEEKNRTLVSEEENIEQIETRFYNTSIDYLSNYAAILHLSSVLLSEKEQIAKFKSFFEWFYSNLKVSRYTVVYVCRLLLGNNDYKEPKKIHGKDISFPESIGVLIENPAFIGNYTGLKNLKVLASIQNRIGDEQIRKALEDIGLDQYEPILITDDQMLGDIFVNGCFNTQPIREFEKNIKTSSRIITEWVDDLLANHKELEVDDYEIYFRKVVGQELDMFRTIFFSKNDHLDNK